MTNDTIFLTCPKCHKTKAFSYYDEIAYVCDCEYLYEGDVLNRLKCKSLRYIPNMREADNEHIQ